MWLTLPHPLKALRLQPLPLSPVIASRLSPSHAIEEEETPHYRADRFYPARLGQVLHGRYQIATKLGHGASSIVWLARDLHRLFPSFSGSWAYLTISSWRWSKERYVAIKINASSHHSRHDSADNELAILKRISQTNPRHRGWHFVRKLLDSFTVDGVSEKHSCLVFEPLREPLWLYCKRFVGDVIPPIRLKIMLQMILHGLVYLHSECQVIHTGTIRVYFHNLAA